MKEILKEFDEIDIPDIPSVKNEYEKLYDDYFRLTAHHQPPDPVVLQREARLAAIKREKVEEEPIVKTEHEIPCYGFISF